MIPTTLEELGPVLATGRGSQIHAWPDDRVVKLFEPGLSDREIDEEVAHSSDAFALGLTPVRCHGRVRVAGRDGLVLDRVHGDSLTRIAEKNPLALRRTARVLGRLHAGIHAGVHPDSSDRFTDVREAAVAALDLPALGFLSPEERGRAADLIRGLPDGDRILHMDFHTQNVFADGPDRYAVIDWQTTLRGDPAADVAASVLLLRDAELWPGTPRLKLLLYTAVRRLILATYLREYRSLTGLTDDDIARWRLPIVVLRLGTWDIESEREGFSREIRELVSGGSA